jgi:hypothetical protein
MSSSSGLMSLLGIALLAAVFGVTGCQKETKPLLLEDTTEITATVTSIDQSKRLLGLKDASGRLITVEVNPEVRNLSQVKVGDRLVVRYRKAFGAQISKEEVGAPTVELSSERAAEGEKPAGQLGARITVPVTIDSIDTQSNTVTFHGQDGLTRTITARTPQGQEFIKQLKKGDHVKVSYEEALAVKIEPAP